MGIRTMATDWDDRINPIAIKELRQAMYGGTWLMLIALALLISLNFLVQWNYDRDLDGNTVFQFLLTGFGIVALVVAVSHGSRFSSERSGDDDLIFATILSPFKIIMGKLCSILAMTALMFFLALPFMAASYMLGGVSIGKMAGDLWRMLLFIVALDTFILMLSSLRQARGRRFSGWLLIVVLFFVFPLFLQLGEFAEEWTEQLQLFIWLFGWSVVFFSLAVASIAHVTANRTLGAKTAGLAVSLIAGAAFMACGGTAEMLSMAAFQLVMMLVFLLIGCCEPLKPSRRVIAGMPRNPLGRIWYFLCSNTCWSALLYAIVLLALPAVEVLVGNDHHGFIKIIAIALYALFYGMVAIMLRCLPVGNKLVERPLLVVLAVWIIVGVLTAIVGFLAETSGATEASAALFFSPAVLDMKGGGSIGFVASAAMSFLALLVLLPRIFADIAVYKRR